MQTGGNRIQLKARTRQLKLALASCLEITLTEEGNIHGKANADIQRGTIVQQQKTSP